MRRGRWVAYCFALVLFFHPVYNIYGATLGMSATVPLSSLWKESLKLNSKAQIDTSHPHILLISQESAGIEHIPVDKQTIQLLIFKKNVLVQEQVKITDKRGLADFVFVSNEAPGTYSVIIVNKTDGAPFVVKNATVSL